MARSSLGGIGGRTAGPLSEAQPKRKKAKSMKPRPKNFSPRRLYDIRFFLLPVGLLPDELGND